MKFQDSQTYKMLKVIGAAKALKTELLAEGNQAHAQVMDQIIDLPMDSAARLFDFFESYKVVT